MNMDCFIQLGAKEDITPEWQNQIQDFVNYFLVSMASSPYKTDMDAAFSGLCSLMLMTGLRNDPRTEHGRKNRDVSIEALEIVIQRLKSDEFYDIDGKRIC
jgi:hypothetical protein